MSTAHRPPTARRVAGCMAMLAMALGASNARALDVGFDFGLTTDRALFQLNDAATWQPDRLRLVSDQPSQQGSAFLKQGLFILPSTDFSTAFQFQISGSQAPDMRSDGFALVFQGVGPGVYSKAVSGDLGGERLGYRGADLPPFPYYSYAIEFDTYANAATGDVSDNEIAVTRSTRQGTQVVAAVDLSSLPAPHPLMDAADAPPVTRNVKVEYGFHGVDRRLSVFLSEGAATPQLVLQTILPDDLFHFGGASTYIGFTAATGGGYANYDILNWQLQVPEPSGLLLTALALLGLGLSRRATTARR